MRTRHDSIPRSPAFEALTHGTPFHDRIAVRVKATPEAIFSAARRVTLADMRLARVLGEIRYLPGRLSGRVPPADNHKPFLSILSEGGTLLLRDDTPRELITASAGRLHRIVDQAPVRFPSVEAFHAFDDPDHEKLLISLRVERTADRGVQWLVLEHATLPLSAAAAQKFARYWRVIKPTGALVTWQLLRAIRRIAQARSVRATPAESRRSLPGDELMAQSIGALTNAITIQRPPEDVWPWLAQMGAGRRAGWYSYDALDNGRRPSARHVIPELQYLTLGMVFPALPGATDGFTLLAFEPRQWLVLGWRAADGTLLVTWAFVLEGDGDRATRLIVRARGGPGYRFHRLPQRASMAAVRLVHFIMERKQLRGIAWRAEHAT
jgi:hypothetical protein